jgi:hypothetical protein
MAIEHNIITDPHIHEPKGVSTAAVDTVYVANGAGSGEWLSPPVSYFWDYNDSETSGSPIALPSNGNWTQLTNDKLGAYTNVLYAYNNITLWANNEFNFSELALGDSLIIRADVVADTGSTNAALDMRLRAAIGSGNEFSVHMCPQLYYKAAAAHSLAVTTTFYIGSNDVKNNPARIEMSADTNTDVVVNGWFILLLRK